MPLPLIPLVALGAGWIALRDRDGGNGDASSAGMDDMSEPSDKVDLSNLSIDEISGWAFPVPPWGDYRADRSQEYKPGPHHGVDIMYPRSRTPNAADRVYQAGTPNGTKNWFMPDGVPVLCPRAGTLWSSGVGAHGPWCVIDTGKPIAIYMVHFDQTLFPLGIKNGAQGIRINAGQMIGTIGASPIDGQKLKHLHIEIWRNGPSTAHVDPWPYLRSAHR